jgi:dephospho-CoA kinase
MASPARGDLPARRLGAGQLRLSVIGLAGSGKSTCASLIEDFVAARGLTSTRLKLAKPLYDLQAKVYETAGAPLRAGAQDQVLMEALASALRRIRAKSLVDDFLVRLADADVDVVVNDDLRDPHVDAVALRARGFRVIRVTADPAVRADRLAVRADLTRSDRSTDQLDLIRPDAVIDNSGGLAAFRDAVHRLVGGWL